MLQESILRGQATYLKRLTQRTDVSLEEIAKERESLGNKIKGIKLDQAIEKHNDKNGHYRI